MSLMNLDRARIQLGLMPPTPEQWDAEIASGWKGSNGSSMSTDTIFGVRIGITSADYEIARGPADDHDYGYRVLRRLLFFGVIRRDEAEMMRARLDLQMRSGLIDLASECPWYFRGSYEIRCFIRWRAVVRAGSGSIDPAPDREQYLAA